MNFKKYVYHGAGMLIWNKDKDNNIFVLLGKRCYNPFKNRWSMPGGGFEEIDGYINKKRAYIKTASRETYEEVGIKVKIKDAIFLWKLHVPFFHWELYEYEIETIINPTFCMEFSDMKWFPIEKIPKNSSLFVKKQIKTLKKRFS